jgi:hypothetical protein
MFPHGIEGLIVIPTAIRLPGPKVGITIGLKNQIDSGKIPLGNEQGSVQYLSRTQKGQQNKTDDQPGSNRYFPLCPIILKY